MIFIKENETIPGNYVPFGAVAGIRFDHVALDYRDLQAMGEAHPEKLSQWIREVLYTRAMPNE